MINVIISAFLILVAIVSLTVPFAGAVIARRASRRWQWPEAKLAFLAFASVAVMAVVSAFTLPLIAWLNGDIVAVDLMSWVSVLFRVANTVAVIAIAVALYQLARRASRSAGS